MNYLQKELLLIFAFCYRLTAPQNDSDTNYNISTKFSTIDNGSVPCSEPELCIAERTLTPCIANKKNKGFCLSSKNCLSKFKHLGKSTEILPHASYCNSQKQNICCGKYLFNSLKETTLLPKTCGVQETIIGSRILGGDEAEIGEFPWLAILYHVNKNGSKKFGCTGFLISSRFVLTAAHCLTMKLKDVNTFGPISEVHFGEHDRTTDIDCSKLNTTCADKVQIIQIKKRLVHSSFEESTTHPHNDIGLIYLQKKVKISKFVSPVCLPEKQNSKPSEYLLGGWGQTSLEESSTTKQKVSISPFPHPKCIKKYSQNGVTITNRQICAGGEKNKDSCFGDSGGPLMYFYENRWYAAGVVSFGMECGHKGWPGVYTNIIEYKGWIKEEISKMSEKNKTNKKTH